MTSDDISVLTLQERLNKMKVPKEFYSLGKYKEEALCLEQNGGMWIIYEGERGNKYNPRKYQSEYEACLAFLDRIKDFL